MKKVLFTIFSATIILSSCTKETRPGPQAQVKFINGSVNTVSAQVFFDEALLVGATGFPNASNYAFVNIGTPTIKVQATTTTSNTYLISGSSSLQSNINYTVIATDSAQKLKVSVVADDISTPVAGKASIRFFNFVGNGPTISVDTSITTASATMFASRSFNDQSTNSSAASFISVNAGIYTFKAKNATTNALLVSKLITLESGKIYTIAVTGAVGATTAPEALAFTVYSYN